MEVTFSKQVLPGDVIAVGDVHATWPLYKQFLDWIRDTEAVVVCLGDMIDRGGNDLEVLRASKDLHDNPEGWGLQAFYALKGNHEQMFLQSFFPPDEDGERCLCLNSALIWMDNGGNKDVMGTMEEEFYDWLDSLPVYITIGETLFVHGGTYPGHDPKEAVLDGRSEALLWMREPFLTYGPELEGWNPLLKRVVHGHTPTLFELGHWSSEPYVKGQRVNIDTGACFPTEGGCLTAYNVTQNTFHQFHWDKHETPAD